VTTNEIHYYDDTFAIEKTRWGTYRSFDKEGKELITALHEDICLAHTRFYLKGKQEGWDCLSCSTYDGEVGGKL
jgi:hypothetical protein